MAQRVTARWSERAVASNSPVLGASDMTTVTRPDPPHQHDPDSRPVVARAVLVAGGSFATAVGAVAAIGSAAALAAVCFIAALTMFTVVYLMRIRPHDQA